MLSWLKETYRSALADAGARPPPDQGPAVGGPSGLSLAAVCDASLEGCGLAGRGEGGAWVEDRFHRTSGEGGSLASALPVNTHGGLMAFGAPWEVPAMYNIIEACEQLAGTAGPTRQVDRAETALVYGNGGIFSHSAVAILGQP